MRRLGGCAGGRRGAWAVGSADGRCEGVARELSAQCRSRAGAGGDARRWRCEAAGRGG
jgi:hypothetical protein